MRSRLPRRIRFAVCRLSPAVCAALLVLAVALPAARAQDRTPPPVDRPARTAQRGAALSELDRGLLDAQQKLIQGKVTQAITLLERLLARHPREPRVVLAMAEAYTRGGEPGKAVGLLEGELERSGGRQPELWMHLATAHRQAGDPEEGIEILLAALRLEPVWLGRMADQLELAATDSATGAAALDRLRQRAGAADAPAAWREALAHVLGVTGAFQEAVPLVARLDREQRTGGRGLARLAAAAARRSDPRMALTVFDSLLAQQPDAALAQEAWLERGRLLEELDRPGEALSAYESLAREHPQGALAWQARLRAATLLRGALRDPARARGLYREILAQARPGSRDRQLLAVREDALLGLGECALMEGRFPEAESTFVALETEALRTETKERAAFERAEMLFYSGRFPEAEEAYYQLTDHYPSGFWVNDALGRALLIGEYGTTAALALEAYAGVVYQARIGAAEEALRLCRTALDGPSHGELRPYLRYEELRLVAGLGQPAAADSVLALLLEQDGGSRVAPRAIYLMAEWGMKHPERREEARRLLEQVILRYPDSLEARRARNRLRQPADAVENS